MTSSVSGMNQAGDRRARARPEVRGRARDRAGDRNAADERRDDVGHALRHQLGVRVVPIAASSSRRRPPRAGSRRRPAARPSCAAGSSGRIRSARNVGSWIGGSPLGMPPNREPIVSTGSRTARPQPCRATSATMEPGTRRSQRRHTSTSASEPTPSASARRDRRKCSSTRRAASCARRTRSAARRCRGRGSL